MDGEAIGTLVVIAFWVISGLLNALGKRKKRAAEPEVEPPPAPAPARQRAPSPPPPPVPQPQPQQAKPQQAKPLGPDTVGDLLREMLDEVQGKAKAEPSPPWQESEVPSEHRQADSETRQAWGETHWDRGEHEWSRGEHQGTLGEHSRAASEHRPTASEHVASASEHRRGDLRRPARALARVPRARRRQSSGAGSAIRQALTDRGSLARALVLKEILGPPVSLRDRSEQGL